MAKLTGKQQRFVDEYLVDLNATAAAKRAGYSERTAYAIGQQNLKKLDIQAAIQAAKQARALRTEIRQDDVLRELRNIAMAEASDEPSSPLRYANKLKALELLCRHLGMLQEGAVAIYNSNTGFVASLNLSRLSDSELETMADEY